MIEYRVKSVIRYIVTRYEAAPEIPGTRNRACGSVEQRGEFENYDTAHAVAYALCAEEHRRAGTKEDDPNFVYPEKRDRSGDSEQKEDPDAAVSARRGLGLHGSDPNLGMTGKVLFSAFDPDRYTDSSRQKD